MVEHSRVQDGVALEPHDQATCRIFYTCSLKLKSSYSTDQDQVPGVVHSFCRPVLVFEFLPQSNKKFPRKFTEQ